MSSNVAPWVQTVGGRAVDLLTPQPEQIALSDIAHALARLPRYNGHTPDPWSVAAHSILVAELVAVRDASAELYLAALLHDAHEAFMGDLIAPMKAAITAVDLRARIAWNVIETRLQHTIHVALGAPSPMAYAWQAAIREADLMALNIERRAFLEPHPRPWDALPEPAAATRIICEDAELVAHAFQERAKLAQDGTTLKPMFVMESSC